MNNWVLTIIEDNADDETRYVDTYIGEFDGLLEHVDREIMRLVGDDTTVRVKRHNDAYEMRIDIVEFKAMYMLAKMHDGMAGIATDIEW